MTSPSFLPLVEEYLTYRRGLRFALETPAWLLRDFARHADRCGHHGPLTIELATGWALSSRASDPAQPARRLAAVRQFAGYLALLEPATEVPPAGLLGRVPHRRQAHIYNEAKLAALLREASQLLPRQGLRPKTYVAFFSLLATTGLRLSEACQLERGDVDLETGLLTVRSSLRLRYGRRVRQLGLHRRRTVTIRGLRCSLLVSGFCRADALRTFRRPPASTGSNSGSPVECGDIGAARPRHEEERPAEGRVSISADRREDQRTGRLAGQDPLEAFAP